MVEKQCKKIMKSKFEELFFEDKEKYSIIITFFNWMMWRDFEGILNMLAQDISYEHEALGCNLPSLFDSEEEEGYFNDGVEFYLLDEEIRITFQMYIKCLELAYKIYIEENGEKEEVKNNLLIIKKKIFLLI